MDPKRSMTALVAMALASMVACGAAAGSDIFVDENATGTDPIGETWCTAYTDLQAALAAAGPDTLIRVADGIYTPTAPNGSRIISFDLASGVELRGGFAGCGAPNPGLRDPVAFETILSGDLNGDDDTGGDNSENSFHVVAGEDIDETAILDGFTITAGHANDSNNPGDRGGGIFIFSFPNPSNPTISNCVIRGNHATGSTSKGGGMYGSENTGTLTGCVFTDNSAANGGGLYNFSQSSPTVVDCLFERNEATALGGGAINLSGEPSYTNCTFHDNTAAGGGGMANVSSSSPRITNCVFTENTAAGGVSPSGGAIYDQGSDPIIVNSLFNGNTAGVKGGAIRHTLGGSLALFNSTFSHNFAGIAGGIHATSGDITVTSCVFWNNTDDGGSGESAQMLLSGSGSRTVDYSCVQGLTGLLGGVGNIGDDPVFLDEDGDDNIDGTPDDNLRLQAGSPCINTGAPGFPEILGVDILGTTDLDDQSRLQGCRVDMGAYETDTVQVPNDFDANGAVDLADFAAFQLCFGFASGNPEWLSTCLCVFDFDASEKIDLADYAAFQADLGP